MDSKKIKLSEILACGEKNEIELDIPATLFLASGDEDGGLVSLSSITLPTNNGSLAVRWLSTAATALLKGCLRGNPKAWEALAFWNASYMHEERTDKLRAKIDKLMEGLENTEQEGGQE